MKVALLSEYRKIETKEMPEPEIGPHDIMFRVMACGICPNDYRIYAGLVTWKKPPTTLGHEPAGVVVKVGSDVKGFKVGDMVAGDGSTRCGHCRFCVAGRENLCVNRRAVGSGSIAEFAAGNEIWMNKFSHATFEEEAFTEPLSCVINGIKNSRVKMGDRVAIVGAGQIGLMHMQMANLLGAKTIVIDIKEERLSFAGRLGATHVVNSSTTDPVAKVKELTGGDGADKVIVAIGNAQAIETGFQLVSPMGSVNLFASTNPPMKVSFDPNLVHHSEVSMIGSYDKTRSELREATRLIDEGKIDVKTLITHRYDLEETGEALRMLEKGAGVKIMVMPNGGS
ncbi:MAG: zinc-binding dehydrogenase [Nitrososphaerales archaeon]|nr:zinc-binding dehydrogenase [Nitrososphaerales archaeon]